MYDSHPPSDKLVDTLVSGLGLVGAADCIAVAAIFGLQPAPGSDFWLLPGLYFLQVGLLGLITLFSLTRAVNQPDTIWRGIPWISTGILFALVVLGAWSIGPFLIPAALAFLIAGLILDLRHSEAALTYIFLALLAGLLLVYAILGAWSMQGFIIPSTLLFSVVALFLFIRHREHALQNFLLFFTGGMLQVLIMYLLLGLH
jgi:hypothetical protein